MASTAKTPAVHLHRMRPRLAMAARQRRPSASERHDIEVVLGVDIDEIKVEGKVKLVHFKVKGKQQGTGGHAYLTPCRMATKMACRITH